MLLLGWTVRFFHGVWRRKYSLNFFRFSFHFSLKLNSFEFVQCCKKGNLFRIFHVLTFFVSSFFPSSTTGVAWASSSACSPCCAVAAPQPSQSRTSTTHPHSCWRCSCRASELRFLKQQFCRIVRKKMFLFFLCFACFECEIQQLFDVSDRGYTGRSLETSVEFH